MSIFQLAGIAVLAVGIWSRIQASDYNSFLGSGGVTSAANIMIVSGALVMVIGFVGCCGAIKESRGLLVAVSMLMVCFGRIFGVFLMNLFLKEKNMYIFCFRRILGVFLMKLILKGFLVKNMHIHILF